MPKNISAGPLVSSVQLLRVRGLRRIDDAVRRGEVDQDSFADALSALLVLDVDAAAVAREAGVGTATVTRWSQGFHVPHRLAMPAVLAAMRRVIAEESKAASAFVADPKARAA